MTEIERIEEFNEIGGYEKEARELFHADILSQLSFISEEYKELTDAFDEKDLVEVVDASADLIVTAAGMIHRLGLSVDETIREVNDSNMSKFCFCIEDVAKSVEKYAGDGRYTNVGYKEVREGVYVIKGDVVGTGQKNKILKGINYRKPDIESIVEGR